MTQLGSVQAPAGSGRAAARLRPGSSETAGPIQARVEAPPSCVLPPVVPVLPAAAVPPMAVLVEPALLLLPPADPAWPPLLVLDEAAAPPGSEPPPLALLEASVAPAEADDLPSLDEEPATPPDDEELLLAGEAPPEPPVELSAPLLRAQAASSKQWRRDFLKDRMPLLWHTALAPAGAGAF